MKQKKELTAEGLMVQLAGHKNPNYFKNKIVFKIDNTNKHLLGVLHIVAPHVKTICMKKLNCQRLGVTYSDIWYIPPIYLDSLIVLNVHNARITELPNILPKSITHINCSNNAITKLPNTLPPQLKTLICWGNNIGSLPESLPDTMTTLKCNGNLIKTLPRHLPKSLITLDACHNQLTMIDAPLPSSLITLDISHNQLTTIDAPLPACLTTLDMYNNQLTTIGTPLPAFLTSLDISYNNITFIGEKILPNSLLYLNVNNNKLSKLPDRLPPHITTFKFLGNLDLHILPDIPASWGNILIDDGGCDITHTSMYSSQIEKNYPDIKSYRIPIPSHWWSPTRLNNTARKNNILTLNEYINECNSQRRTYARTAIINANGALWEAYMRRVMHPTRFGAALLANPDLDIEEYTASYVAAL